MIDVGKVRCLSDNVLVLFDEHARARSPEEFSPGGILMPRNRRAAGNEAVPAVVVAAGPGHFADRWLGMEEGTAPDGSRRFVPMNPGLVRGARVLVEKPNVGDRIWGDGVNEFRMVKEHNVIAILEDG